MLPTLMSGLFRQQLLIHILHHSSVSKAELYASWVVFQSFNRYIIQVKILPKIVGRVQVSKIIQTNTVCFDIYDNVANVTLFSYYIFIR